MKRQEHGEKYRIARGIAEEIFDPPSLSLPPHTHTHTHANAATGLAAAALLRDFRRHQEPRRTLCKVHGATNQVPRAARDRRP